MIYRGRMHATTHHDGRSWDRRHPVLALIALGVSAVAIGVLVGSLARDVLSGVIAGGVVAILVGLWAWRVRRTGEDRVHGIRIDERRRSAEEPYGPAGRAGSSGFGTPGI